jgi:aryl-alcohol dehydrogenase-like predicted oxidoreductase
MKEREMIPYCQEHGIALIPWGPLAAGALARPLGVETARTTAAKGTVFEDKFSDADKAIIGRVEELAKKKGCAMSQIALAVRSCLWFQNTADLPCMQWVQLKVDSPIVGISSVQRLEESIVKGIELTAEEVKYLEEPYVNLCIPLPNSPIYTRSYVPKAVRGHSY